jgi:hypothetical protein
VVDFSVSVFEGPPARQGVSVFYDLDGEADTGDEVVFADDLPITATSAVFSGSLIDEGVTVHVGVTADDGKNPPVTRYANGTITHITPGQTTLTVTQPNSPLPKKPGDQVSVAWQLDGLPTTANAKVDVFMRRVSDTGAQVGAEIPILAPSPLSTTTATFKPSSSGRFQVTVRIVFADGSGTTITKTAPALVVVSTLPGIFWIGDLGVEDSVLAGAVFEGVQFEDNAGSAFAGDVDFDDDGLGEMIIVSRYAKPEFVNPSGVGAGEAYMIRGRTERFKGRVNLNSVGTSVTPGFVFTGIEPDRSVTPPDTDGIASIYITKDADGDEIGEIVFGFPRVSSQSTGGYTLRGPDTTCALTDVTDPQFARGGVVIVSSANQELIFSDADEQGRRCQLDFVGQIFEDIRVRPEPGDELCTEESTWMADLLTFDEGNCPPGELPNSDRCIPGADGEKETLVHPRFGFDERLASPYLCDQSNHPIPCFDLLEEGCPLRGTGSDCDADQLDPENPLCPQSYSLTDEATSELSCDQQHEMAQESLNRAWVDYLMFGFDPRFPTYPAATYGFLSGYYAERIAISGETEPVTTFNSIVESIGPRSTSLIGCRIIGEAVDDAFGTSVTQSLDDLIITSPFSSELETNGGIGYMVENYSPVGFGLPRLWHPSEAYATMGPSQYGGSPPPMPHQYLAGGESHFGVQPNAIATGYQDTGGLRLIGDENEHLRNVAGIPDFNVDGIPDIAIGAPFADVDADGAPDGAVYILYRRAETLEGNYRLANLKIDPTHPERLSGLMVREALGTRQRFGESIVGEIDFNHDDIPDLVVGNPDGNGGTGEVVIIFGAFDLTSPQNGIPVEDEGSTRGLLSRRQGARIRGVETGSEFGITVANVGDVDGDGKDDLAIVAPNATPKFDSNPSDATDQLDTMGLDRNLDGIRDDVSGPLGRPDGKIDQNDNLVQAGLVYIILSSTDAAKFANPSGVMDVSVSRLGSADLEGYILVGRRGQRFDIAGAMTAEGDFLGGGDAGEPDPVTLHGLTIRYGGTAAKAPDGDRNRGRSKAIGRAGDVDGDGIDDLLLGSPLADPRVDPVTGRGTKNGGEAYLIYGFKP